MKKPIAVLFFFFVGFSLAYPQNCTPDPVYVLEGPGVYPDSLVGLPPAYTCQFYSAVITVVVPYDTTIDLGGGPFYTVVDSAVLQSVDDLPPNFSYSCEPPDCNFPGGTAGCILLYGNPDPADTGAYVPVGNVFGYIDAYPGVGFPFAKIDYYIIDISLGGGPLSAAIENTSAISCNGNCNGELTAMATCGFPPYSYLWSNGQTTQTITGLCAGNYSVTVSDSAGSSVANLSLSQPSPITLSFVSADPTVGCNGSITVNPSGGTAPYSYSWTTGDTAQTIFSLCPGAYQVTVTDANGCPPAINAVFLMLETEEVSDRLEFSAFPNPNGGIFDIEMATSVNEIRGTIVMDNLLGETVYHADVVLTAGRPQSFHVDVSALPQGHYLLQLITKEAFFYKKMIVLK